VLGVFDPAAHDKVQFLVAHAGSWGGGERSP